VYQPERELAVLSDMAMKNPGPLSDNQVKTIMQVVMQECRSVQLSEKNAVPDILPLSLPLQAQGTVAYLGPQGTFTYGAVLQYFGADVQAVPTKSMTEAIQKLAAGDVTHAVVAIENSTEGVVNEALDAIIAGNVAIRAELTRSVQFHLLMKDQRDEVRRIYAHPQALAQCRGKLAQFYKGVQQIAVSSNAEATRLASLESGAAALGNSLSQAYYHLSIKQEHLEDFSNNQTRFLLLGAKLLEPHTPSKTTLLAYLRHNSAGQLDKILRVLAAKHLDMTLLVTRPNKVEPWEYVFVFDIHTDIIDDNFQEALVELNTIADVQVLGCYPELKE
jgi:chorismate mutase/prephenate dehydratase